VRDQAIDWNPPVPGTFIADRDGIIQPRCVDADYRRRMKPADILAVLRNLEDVSPVAK
jgi:hypothetical protein